MQKYAALSAVLLVVAACQDATSPRPKAAEVPGINAAQGNAKNDYIVVLQDAEDPDADADAIVKGHNGQLKHIYRKALKGFAISNLSDAEVESIRKNPKVAYVEQDAMLTIDDVQAPTPSWGLDRIDATSGLNNSYTYPNDGAGVRAYIVDTGINPSSADFAGRILSGADFIDGGAPDDCNGHGTHVAGTVGGSTYGVAKNVRIIAVRVLDCGGSGSTSGVIAGVDWVTANAVKPAVANMSLGGGASSALDNAVANAVASGVVFAVAAGNSNANACNYSPARAATAITVAATTTSDAKASYSNFGTCVDINAPGSGIKSDWIGGTTATNTISGTSMASPHVAGAAALYLSANPGASAQSVRDALVNGAINSAVTGLPAGTPNKLLYVGFITGGGGGGGGGVTAPVARISKSCNGFSCTFTSTSTGTVTTYAWNFGNGGTATVAGPHTVAYGARQSATVTLTVSNSGGSSSAQTSVSCNPKKCQ